VAIRGSKGVLLKCKTVLNSSLGIGKDVISHLVDAEEHYQLKHSNIMFQKVAAANHWFSHEAVEFAQIHGVELIDQQKLAQQLIKTPDLRVEIEDIGSFGD